jgi:hypothetical protein
MEKQYRSARDARGRSPAGAGAALEPSQRRRRDAESNEGRRDRRARPSGGGELQRARRGGEPLILGLRLRLIGSGCVDQIVRVLTNDSFRPFSAADCSIHARESAQTNDVGVPRNGSALLSLDLHEPAVVEADLLAHLGPRAGGFPSTSHLSAHLGFALRLPLLVSSSWNRVLPSGFGAVRSLVQDRMPGVKLRFRLERRADPEQHCLVEGAPDDLHPDGEAVGVEAARDVKRGQPR